MRTSKKIEKNTLKMWRATMTAEPLIIDLTGTPPPNEHLVELHQTAIEVKRLTDLRKAVYHSVCCGIVILGIAILTSLSYFGYFSALESEEVQFVVVIGSTVALLGFVSLFCTTFIYKPDEAADKLLADLCELNAEEYPKQCIKYDEFSRTYAQVDRYQTLIAGLGRKPVYAEYKAALDWVDSSKRVLQIDTARKALERMSSVSSVGRG